LEKKKAILAGLAMARNEHLKKKTLLLHKNTKENGKFHSVFYSSLVIPGMF
jgi:hypothetical protein